MGCCAANRGKKRIPHRPGGSPVRTHNNAARLAVASSKCTLDSHHQECRTCFDESIGAADLSLASGQRRVPPDVRNTLDSMKFCSSRMFPLQVVDN